jgi:hypothetical protein
MFIHKKINNNNKNTLIEKILSSLNNFEKGKLRRRKEEIYETFLTISYA